MYRKSKVVPAYRLNEKSDLDGKDLNFDNNFLFNKNVKSNKNRESNFVLQETK